MSILGWIIGGISLLYSITVFFLIYQRILNSNIKKYHFTFYLISLFFSSYLAVTFLGLINILKYKYETFEIFTILGLVIAFFLVFSLRSLIKYVRMKNQNIKICEDNERLKMEFDHLKYRHEMFITELSNILEDKNTHKEKIDAFNKLYSKYPKINNT